MQKRPEKDIKVSALYCCGNQSQLKVATSLLFLAQFSRYKHFFVFCNFAKNSKWPLYLARQKYFENWQGYCAEIPSRSKILLNSLHLAQFSRYKHFCVLQKLRKFKIATIFGKTKIFENKTTAAVCISRRAVKEKK